MYGALIVFSVPMPLLAGWLSDRFGRKPLIVGVYAGGAVGFVAFILAGAWLPGLWIGIVLMGLFSFAESPQLQALLADIAPPSTRDASYALYFTMAFGVGSLWTALYGVIIDTAGEATGLPIVGMGGVASGRHALELLAAGANDVAIGTAMFSDPGAASRIRSELTAELAALGIANPDNVVGAAHEADAPTLDRESRVEPGKYLHSAANMVG